MKYAVVFVIEAKDEEHATRALIHDDIVYVSEAVRVPDSDEYDTRELTLEIVGYGREAVIR